jgi:dCMP deaminase
MTSHKRLKVDAYALLLARVAALRSEDPYGGVGACGLSKANRVVTTGYNGLKAGFVPPAGFWDDREARLTFMIHAEVNACALVTYGDVHTMAVTLLPCRSCATVLVAHGVQRVVFGEIYHRDQEAFNVFKAFNVELIHITPQDLANQVDDVRRPAEVNILV